MKQGLLNESIRLIEKNVHNKKITPCLTADDGRCIEQDAAGEDGVRSGHWIYTATAAAPLGADSFVDARGVDHAGNKSVVSA